MRTVFMGTPEFAVPSLKVLNENTDLVLIVTQADKPQGRGHILKAPPVKQVAQSYGIKVVQPEKIRKNTEFINLLKDIKPDLIVVTAYGKILSKEILDVPLYGCINVHASLLPKYRGAAPINWAIINGEKQTGITTMYMDTGLDTGDMILKKTINIDDNDTAGTLHDKLKILGAETLKETLELIKGGKIQRIPQDDSKSTYAPMMDKKTGLIDWNKDCDDIINLIRGTNPWPVAYTYYEGQPLKIWTAKKYDIDIPGKPGQVVISDEKEGIIVKCGDGCIQIVELQMPNSRRMTSMEYLRGHMIEEGIILDNVR